MFRKTSLWLLISLHRKAKVLAVPPKYYLQGYPLPPTSRPVSHPFIPMIGHAASWLFLKPTTHTPGTLAFAQPSGQKALPAMLYDPLPHFLHLSQISPPQRPPLRNRDHPKENPSLPPLKPGAPGSCFICLHST